MSLSVAQGNARGGLANEPASPRAAGVRRVVEDRGHVPGDAELEVPGPPGPTPPWQRLAGGRDGFAGRGITLIRRRCARTMGLALHQTIQPPDIPPALA